MTDVTHVHLLDVEDAAPGFGLDAHLSSRFATRDLGAATAGLSLQRLRPHARPPFAHRHDEAEEIYVVLSGSGWMEADGKTYALGERDAVRVAPPVVRAFTAGPAGLELLALGARHEGDGAVVDRPAAEEAPVVPPAQAFSAVLAALPVADPERAELFYAALLGRPADAHPMPGLAQWELEGAGTVQVVVDEARAGGGLLTLLTHDLDGVLAAAAGRGLDVPAAAAGEVVDAYARLADPDGNAITLVGAPPAAT